MEELKAIIELINSLGLEAQKAFYMYLAYRFAAVVLGYCIATLFIILAYKLIRLGIFQSAIIRLSTDTFRRWATYLGINPHYDPVENANEVISKIDEILEKNSH